MVVGNSLLSAGMSPSALHIIDSNLTCSTIVEARRLAACVSENRRHSTNELTLHQSLQRVVRRVAHELQLVEQQHGLYARNARLAIQTSFVDETLGPVCQGVAHGSTSFAPVHPRGRPGNELASQRRVTTPSVRAMTHSSIFGNDLWCLVCF